MNHLKAKHFWAKHFAATHFVLSVVITSGGNIETRIDAVKVDDFAKRTAAQRNRILKQEEEDILVILQIWIKCV